MVSVYVHYTMYNVRGGQRGIVQTQKTTLYPIGKVDTSNRNMLTFTQTGTNEIIPISFYGSYCDDSSVNNNVSEIIIDIQGDLPPITTNSLDVQYFQFDTTIMFQFEIPASVGYNSSDCFLSLLVFRNRAAFQTFLNRGIWSEEDSYQEICIQENNFSANITLRGGWYYYSGLYIPFDSQQHIGEKVKYHITGVTRKYNINSFIYICTINRTATCVVQISSLDLKKATTSLEVCITGYLLAGQGTGIKNAVIEYKTDGTPTSIRNNLFYILVSNAVSLPLVCFFVFCNMYNSYRNT